MRPSIILNLPDFFRSKGIDKPFSFMVKLGLPPHAARKLLYGQYKSVPLHHIAVLCERLWCTPNELFAWSPHTPADDIPNHPLQQIRLQPNMRNLNAMMMRLPPDKVEQLWKTAQELEQEGK